MKLILCGKGGSGKSTLATLLARAAARQGRKVLVQTDDDTYSVKKNLSAMEEELNNSRFIRISQSEIINIYKVKRFDINIAGTIGVEFENGTKSWASRSCVKSIKNLIKA